MVLSRFGTYYHNIYLILYDNFAQNDPMNSWDVADEDVQALGEIGTAVDRVVASPIAPKSTQITPGSTHRMVRPIDIIDLKLALCVS